MAVAVYSKPGCNQCNATYLQFDKAGITKFRNNRAKSLTAA